MSQQQGNDLAAPEPLANTEPDESAKGTIEDKLNDLIDDLIPVHRQDDFRAAIVEAVEGLIKEPTKNMPTTYARIMQAIKEWQ